MSYYIEILLKIKPETVLGEDSLGNQVNSGPEN